MRKISRLFQDTSWARDLLTSVNKSRTPSLSRNNLYLLLFRVFILHVFFSAYCPGEKFCVAFSNQGGNQTTKGRHRKLAFTGTEREKH